MYECLKNQGRHKESESFITEFGLCILYHYLKSKAVNNKNVNNTLSLGKATNFYYYSL